MCLRDCIHLDLEKWVETESTAGTDSAVFSWPKVESVLLPVLVFEKLVFQRMNDVSGKPFFQTL
jgi:hypothetical protein